MPDLLLGAIIARADVVVRGEQKQSNVAIIVDFRFFRA